MESISNLFIVHQLLSWRAIVEILLLALGLFFLYRTLMRLGTWKIAVGVLAAILVFLAAALLDLKAIEWVFENISHVAVIALIVIFQPELRKIFERAVSMKRTEGGGRGEALSRLVQEGMTELARQKRGAIIVFPGKEPVGEWLSGGFGLDAEASLPLLLSIFDPHSPGHDGALVIENGKFSRYGVRLPVSDTSKLPREYGRGIPGTTRPWDLRKRRTHWFSWYPKSAGSCRRLPGGRFDGSTGWIRSEMKSPPTGGSRLPTRWKSGQAGAVATWPRSF